MTLNMFTVAFFVLVGKCCAKDLQHLGQHSHLRTSNHVVKEPRATSNLTAAGLVALASNCSCSFRGVCSCEEAMEFMNCIKDHMNSGKCESGDHHFLNACHAMGTTCPKVGLVCSEDKASCPATTPNATATATPLVKAQPAAVQNSSKPTVVQTQPIDIISASSGSSWYKFKWYYDNFNLIVMGNAVYILLTSCAAYIYSKYRNEVSHFFLPGRRPLRKEAKSFAVGNGLFSSILSDPKLLLFSCCCPAVRWADTVDRANLSVAFKYWFAFLSMTILAVLGDHTFGLAWLCLVGMGVTFRQRMRGRGTIKDTFQDTLAWAFCIPCAIAQEAREEAHNSIYLFDA